MDKTKVCTKCKKEYPATKEYFNKQKQHSDGLDSHCKECVKAYKKEYYRKNKERVNKKNKENYYKNNPKEYIPKGYKKCSKCNEIKLTSNFGKKSKAKDGLRYDCKECRKREHLINREANRQKANKWYIDNREYALQFGELYRQKNKEKYREYMKQYYIENKRHLIQTSKEYLYNRIENDIGFRILQRCRTRLYQAVKGYNKSARTQELIGCSIDHLLKHLEMQFTDGMTWENYGEWHIDHIIPCASFNFENEEEQYECFNYTNLQPLWAEDNFRKSDKVETL